MSFRRPAFIARQSSRPSGLLGRILARIMAHETSAANLAAVRALDVTPDDRVLEIGFGHGRTVELLAATAPGVVVDGVDLSADMVRTATRRCAVLVDQGWARLQEGDSAHLPYADETFDKVLSVHTLYFWAEPLAHLREVRRVTKRNGAFVLGFHEASDEAVRSFPSPVYRFHSSVEVASMLRAAGFENVRVDPVAAGVQLARALA